MSSETIEVHKRAGVGSIAARKLRRAGRIPAILYGHGEENVNLSVDSEAIDRVIQHGAKLLSLTGDVSDTALLRDVQWDAFGIDVLHVDLTRVSQTEAVEITLPIELHGVAPGASEGGVLSVNLHEITISCPASKIPDHIQVNIGDLHLGDSVLASEVALPEGATLVTKDSDVVVHIGMPSTVEEEGEEAVPSADGSEPELIRKEKEEEKEE